MRFLAYRLNLKNSSSSSHSLVALWRKVPSIWRTLKSSQDLGPTRSTSLVSFSMVGRWGFSRESSLARGKVRRRAARASFWSLSRSLVFRNVSHDDADDDDDDDDRENSEGTLRPAPGEDSPG